MYAYFVHKDVSIVETVHISCAKKGLIENSGRMQSVRVHLKDDIATPWLSKSCAVLLRAVLTLCPCLFFLF